MMAYNDKQSTYVAYTKMAYNDKQSTYVAYNWNEIQHNDIAHNYIANNKIAYKWIANVSNGRLAGANER